MPLRQIGLAAQPIGERIGVIYRDQQGVNVIHQLNRPLGVVRITLPQNIHAAPAQFSDYFRQSVQVNSRFDVNIGGQRQFMTLNDRAGD